MELDVLVADACTMEQQRGLSESSMTTMCFRVCAYKFTDNKATAPMRSEYSDAGNTWLGRSHFYWSLCISTCITVTSACCGLIDHVLVGSCIVPARIQ